MNSKSKNSINTVKAEGGECEERQVGERRGRNREGENTRVTSGQRAIFSSAIIFDECSGVPLAKRPLKLPPKGEYKIECGATQLIS